MKLSANPSAPAVLVTEKAKARFKEKETVWSYAFDPKRISYQGSSVYYELKNVQTYSSDEEHLYGSLDYELAAGSTPNLYGEWKYTIRLDQLSRNENGEWFHLFDAQDVYTSLGRQYVTVNPEDLWEKEGGKLSPYSVDLENRLEKLIKLLDQGDLAYAQQEITVLIRTARDMPLHRIHRLAYQALAAYGRAEARVGIFASAPESQFRKLFTGMFTGMSPEFNDFVWKVFKYRDIESGKIKKGDKSYADHRRDHEIVALAKAAVAEFGEEGLWIMSDVLRSEIEYGKKHGPWADDADNVCSVLALFDDRLSPLLARLIEHAAWAEQNPWVSEYDDISDPKTHKSIIGESDLSTLIAKAGKANRQQLKEMLGKSSLPPNGKIVAGINRHLEYLDKQAEMN